MTSIRVPSFRFRTILPGILVAFVVAGLPSLASAKEDNWDLRKDKDGDQ